MSSAFAQSAKRSSRAVSRDSPRRLRMFRGINADGLCWCHQVWDTSAWKCADGCRNAGNDRPGKRPRGSVEAITDRPTSSCRLLTIHDPVSNLSYLIDTGAEVSVLPPRSEDRARSPINNMQLQAANGIAIRTFRQRSVEVESFEWSFTIADVTKPILGADFLRHYGLLVDLKYKRLMDAETFLAVPTSYRRSTVSKLCVLVKNDCYSDILNEFKEVTTPCVKKYRLLGKVEHHTDTRCRRPVFVRARRLSPDKLAAAKKEFKKLLETDVIQPSNSPWSSPLHMVEKPSGGWRACGDYRVLNAASEDDRYPMPHLQDFTIQLEGKSIFSKVDLVWAYNQVPMNSSDIAKTAIVTPFGLFEFKRMPFGLKNAAQTFQRLMDTVLRDCSFAYVYVDDILVASSSVGWSLILRNV